MICVLKGDFMDTSYYHNFITLVQTGNMTQAAEILHITQPALSKQLKYLEAEFGAQLINIKRGQRGSNLQLTDAGKIFYEKAQQLCSIEESTYNAVQQLNSRIEGTLRIATSASRSTPIVQQYLPAFSSSSMNLIITEAGYIFCIQPPFFYIYACTERLE